jgi:general secretion pathway protein K
MRRADEKGVALLTVLLLVAVMSVIAVGVLDDIRFGVRRAANARGVGQAQWYALGAEELARVRIVQLQRANANRTTLEGGWNGRVFAFPVEHGTIQARMTDGTGCFNLNSVVEDQGDRLVRRELGVRQFAALLRELGVPDGRGGALAADLVDWIDTDDLPSGGAEDGDYARRPTPYRTGGALLAEVSELRAVRGFSPEIYGRLRPWVCALPTSDLSPVNVNTLAADRALLITALTLGATPRPLAARALAGRPADGWASAAAFWDQPALVDNPPPEPVRGQIGVRTRFFNLDADVTFADTSASLSALLESIEGGDVTLAARRWTRDE